MPDWALGQEQSVGDLLQRQGQDLLAASGRASHCVREIQDAIQQQTKEIEESLGIAVEVVRCIRESLREDGDALGSLVGTLNEQVHLGEQTFEQQVGQLDDDCWGLRLQAEELFRAVRDAQTKLKLIGVAFAQ